VKFGASTYIWASPFSNQTLGLLKKAKGMGFDILEICVEQVNTIDPIAIKDAALEAGIKVLICGAFGPDRDISSENPEIRKTGIAYIKTCADIAQAVGSGLVSGPMYSTTGKCRLLSDSERKQQWKWAMENMKTVADYAGEKNVKLAVEPLNRFETDFINTVDQGLLFFEDIGRDNVGFLLDTFHMNIEEKDMGAALRRAGKKIFNFHACSNDRGTPGEDHLPWEDIADALKDVRYNNSVVIESFTADISEIARAVSLWRPLADSQDQLASDGLAFLKRIF
jgi:D-psicose/D-tagatose/L-ribulose 3-epimerase